LEISQAKNVGRGEKTEEAQVNEIKEMAKKGYTHSQIAEALGISKASVYQVLHAPKVPEQIDVEEEEEEEEEEKEEPENLEEFFEEEEPEVETEKYKIKAKRAKKCEKCGSTMTKITVKTQAGEINGYYCEKCRKIAY
jgi:predicted transcriptional regulator